MKKQYDVLALIGRFQGLHKAHEELLEIAGKMADKVVVIIGSAGSPRSPKNPWTSAERAEMLSPVMTRLAAHTGASYHIDYNVDTIYDNDGWVARIQDIVYSNSGATDRIGLIGHKKDMSTKEYLEMFPQWEFVGVDLIQQLDATQIREIYFSDNYNPNFLAGVVSPTVLKFLDHFRMKAEFEYIMNEKRVIADRKKAYENLPYPHVAVTVDAVVTMCGHLLLIKRKSAPGKGLWALPGGYFDAVKDATPTDGILRELEEETLIDLPKKILRGSIKKVEIFSHPSRSQLGRSITFAAHIPLENNGKGLPTVTGADDAERARWTPFVEIDRSTLFDDHYDIISNFIPLVNYNVD